VKASEKLMLDGGLSRGNKKELGNEDKGSAPKLKALGTKAARRRCALGPHPTHWIKMPPTNLSSAINSASMSDKNIAAMVPS
jgi:hypothetical protein